MKVRDPRQQIATIIGTYETDFQNICFTNFLLKWLHHSNNIVVLHSHVISTTTITWKVTLAHWKKCIAENNDLLMNANDMIKRLQVQAIKT